MTLLAILVAACGFLLILFAAQASAAAQRRLGVTWTPAAMRLIGAGLVLVWLVLLYLP